MSTLHLRQLKAHFDNNYESIIDLSDISGSEEDLKNQFYTRSIALFSLTIETGLTPEELGDSLVDGYDDNGIDAIFYDARTRVLYLVQSKWHNSGSGSIDRGSTQKYLKGVKDLLNGRLEKFNQKVQDKTTVINSALDDPKTKINLITTYAGRDPLSSEIIDDINDFMAEQNDPAEIITHKNHRLQNLYSSLVVGAQGASIQQDILLYGWGTIKEPHYAVYGQIAASDAAIWIENHGYSLFAPNIRVFLGETSVNDGIISTLLISPENFWYYNNGITALCTSVEKKPIGGSSHDSGTFSCQDLRIVNGAQTVGSIAKAYSLNEEQVSQSKVQVRIISLQETPVDFEKEVTRTNNTQNRIDSRDFVSLDQNQERLKTELLLEGVEYVYKTGENYTSKEHGFDFVEGALARVCMEGTLEMAVMAKGAIGKLWEDIEKTPYKLLFNPSVNGPKLWHSVKIMRIIDDKLSLIKSASTGRNRLIAVHGNRAIAHSVFQEIDEDIKEKDRLEEEDISAIRTLTQERYDHVLSKANELYPDSYPASLFKNNTKTRAVIA